MGSALQPYELEIIDPIKTPITAKTWMYIRLHGNNDEHYGRYSDEDLQKQVLPAILYWLKRGIDVFVYILNDDDNAGMPLSAMSLQRLCYEALKCKIPKAPKQVASITNFFISSVKKKKAKLSS